MGVGKRSRGKHGCYGFDELMMPDDGLLYN